MVASELFFCILLYATAQLAVLQIPISRWPVLGQGYLLPDAGSPGGDLKRPYLNLYLPHKTITTQWKW